MAITLFGSAASLVDSASAVGVGPTVTIVPPASMQLGDLCCVWMQYRSTSIYLLPNNTGGQTWNVERSAKGAAITGVFVWCRFNGTWASNPTFSVWSISTHSFSGVLALTAVMTVFRPTTTAKWWIVNVGADSSTYTAPTTPFTVTRAGVTPTKASNVTIAAWGSADDNTWGTLAGAGWSKTGLSAQYRNTTGTDTSCTLAYKIQSTATLTGNVSQNQATLGGDAGITSIVCFAEIDMPSGGPIDLVEHVQSGGTVDNTATANMPHTLAHPVHPGHAVVGWWHWETVNGGNPVSVTDDKGNEYIPLTRIYDNQLDQGSMIFWLPNVQNSPITFTGNLSAGETYKKMCVHEISGITAFDKASCISWFEVDSFSAEIVHVPNISPSVAGCYLFGAAALSGVTAQDRLDNAPGWITRVPDNALQQDTTATYDRIQGAAASVALDINMSNGANTMAMFAAFRPSVSPQFSVAENSYPPGSVATAPIAVPLGAFGAEIRCTRVNWPNPGGNIIAFRAEVSYDNGAIWSQFTEVGTDGEVWTNKRGVLEKYIRVPIPLNQISNPDRKIKITVGTTVSLTSQVDVTFFS